MGLFDDIVANSRLGLQRGNTPFFNTEFVPSGIQPIDHILGGGAALGRILEIFGNESSGKSLFLYKLFIQNTKRGGISILRESEGAFNPDFYESLGGDPAQLLVKAADTVEEVFDEVLELAEQKLKGKVLTNVIVGWDSVAATATKHLLKEGMDKVDMTKAKMLSQGFQLVTNKVAESKISFVCVNQTRQSIGTQDTATVTPGGKALPFFSSQRLELKYDGGSKSSLIKQDENDKDSDAIGRWIKCQVVKNKVAPAWKHCSLPIYSYGGLPHPEFNDTFTEIGIDENEALFEFYLRGRFLLPDRSPVLAQAGSRYVLHKSLDPSETSFYKKEWLDIVEACPRLKTLVYELPPVADPETSEIPAPPPPVS
jgi:recombination protein RecA